MQKPEAVCDLCHKSTGEAMLEDAFRGLAGIGWLPAGLPVWRRALLLLLSAVVIAVPALAGMRGLGGSIEAQRGEPMLEAHYINGIFSLWILLPFCLAAGTPKSRLRGVTRCNQFLRRLTMSLLVGSCFASLVTWYRWIFNGLLDELFAAAVISTSLVTGLGREPWVASLTIFFLFLTLVIIIVETALQAYQPWPHMLFRSAALATIHTALNGGLCLADRRQGLRTVLLLATLGFPHLVLEFVWAKLWCEEEHRCGELFSPSCWLWGALRTGLTMLLFIYLLKQGDPEHCEGGPGRQEQKSSNLSDADSWGNIGSDSEPEGE